VITLRLKILDTEEKKRFDHVTFIVIHVTKCVL
jgi:hypothetical protein